MKTIRRAAIFAWFITSAVAADDPMKVLERVTIKQLVRAAKLPNYTCIETVTRDYYKLKKSASVKSCSAIPPHSASDPALPLTVTDRLRLDVALTERREIYSWVGDSKFEDDGVTALVRHGPIATGAFGALVAVVFGQDAKTFHFEKNIVVAGRNLMEFTFQMASEESRYQVLTRKSWIHAAYHGTVQIDPVTDEVVRLFLETEELPRETSLCRTSTAMDLGPVKIGDGIFLLPQQGKQAFVELNGDEEENTTTFAACREYLGESTIVYSPEEETAGAKANPNAPSKREPLAAGLPFTFELTKPISADTAAAGDSFTGRLTSALRDKTGKILAPAHATIEGRLLRVEIRRAAPLGANLVLNPRTVEIGGVSVALNAQRDWAQASRQTRGRVAILLPYSWERNSGLFQVTGNHAVMKAGFRSDWVTLEPSVSADGAK